MIAMAEAEQEKLRKEGAGRAAAVEAEGRAEAAKIEAIGLAQAKAIEAQGVAEAAAILRKAEAWKEFNDAARLQTVLEKLPAIHRGVDRRLRRRRRAARQHRQAGGDRSGQRRSGGRTAASAGSRKTSPAIVFNLLQQLEALGLNVPSVLQQLGVNPAALPPNPAAPAPPDLPRRPRSVRRADRTRGAGLMMISIAGPYRSGTGDDPDKMDANVKMMEAFALPLFRAGHIPVVGE